MTKGQFLGEFEQITLLAVARLRAEAYGGTIRREIQERTGRRPSIGAMYSTLDRLTEKGYLRATDGPREPGRGGRPKRFFVLKRAGILALLHTRRMTETMWEGVELGEGSR
jgi:DNA-binding PadR family transcriptional regulator